MSIIFHPLCVGGFQSEELEKLKDIKMLMILFGNASLEWTNLTE